MKELIFLDDERNPEDVFWIDYPEYKDTHIVRRMCDFMFVVISLGKDLVNYDISFDHDIQDFQTFNDKNAGEITLESTGYDCAKWLCEHALENDIDLSEITFYTHTNNPIGKKNIRTYLDNFIKFHKENMNNVNT